MKRALLVVVVVAVAAGAYFMWKRADARAEAPTFRLAEAQRGDVVSTITATGTVEPEEVVDVGAQVAGMVLSFGKDEKGQPIDYGSEVEAGTVLANIDDSLYAMDVAQSKAQLDSAKAAVVRAEADLGTSRARLDQAQRDWDRAQKLGPSELLAQSAYDAYKAAYDGAVANVAVSEAAIAQARAGVALAEAALKRAQRNLGYCVISSPVKGVIVDRRVNIGQTVVSSLNAPSLFLIAKDLSRVQVWAAVNEADVSSVHPGQPANFTVDAYPGRTFKGTVEKIRLNASMTQNVVTYTVVITADNSENLLLPYLTANVRFEVQRSDGVITVANAALRWTPTDAQIDPQAQSAATPSAAGGERHRGAGAGAGHAGESAQGVDGSHKSGTLWIPSGAYAHPVRVRVGVTDGAVTEVAGPDVSEGMKVIIGEERPQAAAAPKSTNPFTPQINRGRPQGGQQGGQPGGGSQRPG